MNLMSLTQILTSQMQIDMTNFTVLVLFSLTRIDNSMITKLYLVLPIGIIQ